MAKSAIVPRDLAAPATCDRNTAGHTVYELARRFRVSPEKIRSWIRRGELTAINVAGNLCGRPRWVVTPEALADFEKARAGGQSPRPKRVRRLRFAKNFFPD